MTEPVNGLTLTVTGPGATGGRLALSEMARVAGELQATLERIALGLVGQVRVGAGRRPQDIVEAVRLDVTGLRGGSAILDIAPPDATLIEHGLLAESLGTLQGISLAIVKQHALPEAATPQVIDGLLRLAGGLSPGNVTLIELRRTGGSQPLLTVDAQFQQSLRTLRHRRTASVTIIGRLQMGDFAPSALKCRVDSFDASVSCSFDDGLRSDVLAAMDQLVMATGTAEFSGQVLRSLAIESLRVVEGAATHALHDLAEQQAVSPVEDLSSFWVKTEDDEFAAFMTAALSARPSERA